MRQTDIYTGEHITQHYDLNYIAEIVIQSFKKIAPFWPLKNLIAVNPLQGFEDLPIEEAMKMAAVYFEQKDLPKKMEAINRETIKWLQVYFDEGQATISMPLRTEGLYTSWRKLVLHDVKLHRRNKQKQEVLKFLPKTAAQTIAECLLRLGVPKEEHVQFLILMLTTLPGWAAYIKYRTEWAGLDSNHPYPVSQEDYLAMRLVITSLFWPEAKLLIDWHREVLTKADSKASLLQEIQETEKTYRFSLIKKLVKQPIQTIRIPEAQLVFCIDVRSEPFRKSLESIGDYQTFGFAGFFGIPVKIKNPITNERYSSCPVLLSPKHEVEELPGTYQACENDRKGYEFLITFKRLYQSVKYTFTTPFALVESLGIMSCLWMALRTLAPKIASKLKTIATQTIRKDQEVEPLLYNITFADQCSYAENALKMMGLTSYFAPIVVFCGHGSTTQNNAYASALDCGACGGRHGISNARILAAILNQQEVRMQLSKNGIAIPQTTCFIAAQHNTTTDEVILYGISDAVAINKLKRDLEKARSINSWVRLQQMEQKLSARLKNAVSHAWLRSEDWAQVRPEWGLARNAAFIVAPRDMTRSLNLEGRCFLHSYDYAQDPDGSSLTIILTAPMVVAQWINTQYLFSTLNNVVYGAGSKITKNITGKIGTMQGNASDLMTGLPLQSVHRSDTEAYHEPQRLMTVVLAPLQMLNKIISVQPVLQKLFGNGWVQMIAIEPDSHKVYLLDRDLLWKQMH